MGPLTVGRWFVLCSPTSTTARSSPVLEKCCSPDQRVSCSAGSCSPGPGGSLHGALLATACMLAGVVLPTYRALSAESTKPTKRNATTVPA